MSHPKGRSPGNLKKDGYKHKKYNILVFSSHSLQGDKPFDEDRNI